MRAITKVFVISVMILMVGFTIVSTEAIYDPMFVNSESFDEESVISGSSILAYTNLGEMTASWYGPKFHGKMTANGEIYDQNAFTAAHKKYSFGTLLKITNPRNQKSIIVRINDRGPYISGRQLDLSKASAQALGILERGVVKVQVEQLSLKGANFPVINLN